MSITWTSNDEIVVPWTTVSPVQSMPGWTSESGMIGPPAASALPAGRSRPASTVRMSSRRRKLSPTPGWSLAGARGRIPGRAAWWGEISRRDNPSMAATRSTRPGIVALRFEDGVLRAIDQTELPWRELVLELRTADDVAGAIRRLAIRGAPLIGVAAAHGGALELARGPAPDTLARAPGLLPAARPPPVNLAYGVDR